ncbi:MAG TPA: hypothetical protein VGR54_09260 [Nitrosopumilaceae archaeon]|nr:hypothetical protein [Nitrosopumilaceae archaeon]
MIDSYDVMKALVTLAIEKTLLDTRKPAYDTVTNKLYKKFHCYISDCFEKPEYLKVVLKELYGESYNEIIHSIQQELDEFVYKKRIKAFLLILLQ